MLLTLKISTLIASILCATSMNGTSYENTSLDRTFENFGSLNGFYHWATVIAYGSGKIIDKDIVEEIRNVTLGDRTDPQQKTELGKKILQKIEKMFYYVFISLIIAVLLFIVGLVVLLLQCCSCLRIKTEDKKKNHTVWWTPIYLIFYVIIFSIILSGIIIHNKSSSYLFSTIDNTENYVSSISQYFEAFIKYGVDSVILVVDSILKNTTDELSDNADKLLRSTTDAFRNITGLYNIAELNKKLNDVKSEMDQVSNDSKLLEQAIRKGIEPTSSCSKVLNASLSFITNFVQTSHKLSEDFKSQSETINQVLAHMDENFNQTAKQLSTTISRDATQKWDSIKQKLLEKTKNTILDGNRKFEEKVKETVDKMLPDSLLSLFKRVLFIIIIVPAIIVLLFVLSSFILLLVNVLSPIVKIKIYTEGCVSTLSSIGFYTICFITWLIILVSCGDYMISWSLSGICLPFFDDPQFSVYNSFKITVKDYKENYTEVPLDVIIQRCKDSDTLYRIAEDFKILNMKNLTEQNVIMPIETALSSTIDSLKIRSTDFVGKFGTIKNDLEQVENKITDAKAKLDEAYSEVSGCIKSSGEKMLDDIDSRFTKLKRSLQLLQNKLADLNQLLKPQYSLTQNDVITLLDALHKSASKTIVATIGKATNQVTHKLSEDVFSCRGLYEIYVYTGSLLCKGIRYPLSGMWAVAVVLWTSFLATAVIFYIRAGLVCSRRMSTISAKANKLPKLKE